MSSEFPTGSFPRLDPDPVSSTQDRAVRAYASTLLLDPEAADAAAEDALGAYRQTLRRQPADAPASDDVLLALTRLMTAVSLPDRSSPADRRQAVLASIGAQSHCTCRESGVLLAARANGNIQPRESVALDDHLADCADCRQFTEDLARAEAAFQAEVRPRGGGFGLPGGATARVAFSAATVVAIGAAAAVFALVDGSPHHTAAAAQAPKITTPIVTHPEALTATVHTAPVHHVTVHHPAVKKAATHTATTPTPTATTVATTPVADTTPADTSPPVDTAPAATTTPATTPAATPPAHTATTPAAPPPAAAVSSSSGSLGAETVTQQGIGTIAGG